MINTIEDVEPPYRSGDSDKVRRDPKWPSVEDATRRINVLIEGQVEGPEADMAARDLIVLMRELGRVTAENRALRKAAEPAPTQGDGEMALELLNGDLSYRSLAAALRQRADEATRNENIGCAALVERLLQRAYQMDSAYEPIVAAIRARIMP